MSLVFTVMILALSGALTWGQAEATHWEQALAAKRLTPGLVQFYDFAEGRGLTTRNLADDSPFSEVVIAGNGAFAGQEQDCPRWVSGRWPGKSALSIGTMRNSIGRTHFYGVEGKNFTVELWVRTAIGTGKPGQMVLASVGNAYSDGWRLISHGQTVDFILGRKPGQGEGLGMVMVQAKDCLRPHVWQQLVAVLKDETLQLYVDGVLAAEQPFDGVYTHLATPANRYRTPEIDTRGGLVLGTSKSHESFWRFDVDELAIYERALTAGEIAALHTAGLPEETEAEQAQRHLAELARQAQLEAITIELPKDTLGYFPNDRPIPLSVVIGETAAPLFGEKAQVELQVKRFQGETLLTKSLRLDLPAGQAGRLDYEIPPGDCGLYVLIVNVCDSTGAVLKSSQFDFAQRLPLPPRDEIPPTSMLASYIGLDRETITFGTKVQRIIQPIYGRADDGTPNYGSSAAAVDECVRLGLDVLYCINIGIWENGRYKTVEDWKADPSIHTDHVRNLALRYKGKVKYWEIFNEPNAHGMSAKDYVELLKQAHAIFKEIDPEAKIVGPCGTSSYHDWTEAVLAAGGGPYLDIVSFHNYIGRTPLKNRALGRVEAVKASMRKYLGRELPMWNSECGIHHPERIDGQPATDEELLKLYGGRARRTADGVQVGVNAIMMVNEHLSACWQAQSLLTERAEGIEKYFLLMRPSQPYPSFSAGDEVVTEMGVALVAAQSVLVDVVKARFVPTTISGTTCVALVDSREQTRVAVFADQPVSVVFRTGLPGGAAIKGMDYLGNPLSFTADTNGLLALDLSAEPLYLIGVPESFAVNVEGLSLSCAQSILEPMSRVEVIAEVRNPYDRPVTAELQPSVSAGAATVQENAFQLGPGETRRIPIVWQTGGMEKGRPWMRAQLLLDGQFFSVVEDGEFYSHGKTTLLNFLPGAITLDCDPEKWADIPAEIANSREQAVIGRPVEGAPDPAFWAGATDLSYTVKTAWTAAGVHFLIAVEDNVLRPPANAEEDQRPYLFDGLELFVDARPLADRQAALTAGAVQALVALRLGDVAAECPVKIFGKKPQPVTVTCVSRKTDSGYLIEGTIAPVAGGPLELRDGAQINLDFSIDDNDDRPDQATKLGRRVQMALHGTADNHRSTAAYGRYRLSAAMLRSNLMPNGSLLDGQPLPGDAREKEQVPGWRITNIEKLAPATNDSLFWGAKEIDGKKALWIGSGAEAHIEPVWDSRVAVKAGTGYNAACLLRGRVDGEAQWASCRASVMFFNEAGSFIGHRELGGLDVKKTPDQWRLCESNFITPADTASIGFRASILSKGVVGFANYYWTQFELREIDEMSEGQEAFDPEKGKQISRTMAALATSTPAERKPVRLLFYGQSITAQAWSHQLARQLQNNYFCADFSYENRAIGGFTAERLVKTARQDLYPYYPDLVIFHDYGGLDGEWEAMIRELRTTTTAEILIFTHHLSHQDNAWVAEKQGKESQMIREIAAKYDCELVDVRELWTAYLAEQKLEIKDLLKDSIHLNDRGCDLMASMIWKHLQYNPAFPTPHDAWIRHIPVTPAADGSITVEFTGNRVDIVAGEPVAKMGTASLLIDGEPPSANPRAYAVTRASSVAGAWWPAIYTVGSENPSPQLETWTLTVTDVPAEGPFAFTVAGSVTGPDGAGTSDQRFVSDSKRVVVEPEDFGIASAEAYTKKKCPVGFQITWKIEPMFTDTYEPPETYDPALTNSTRVTQLIANGPHILTIIPNGNGPVPIKEVIVYEPPLSSSD